ncbi:hypothetical protein PLEOSDRAFT_32249 [Pleurotus ostreatus PC15]|uniref:histone acetyltransferase n=1 Tax=Pleurotus ostreatus (strain PC15) TaxID=1137138 RepID=A0A067NQY1_PLEO1|nr:hypothetical protein PLEOSDRAFT_32249 [Pleurotus ostreatus PC15]
MTTNLRDSILAALAKLPGTREFHLHVLVSAPRKHSELYQFAQPRPRTYLQDILILLSEQKTPDSPRILVTAVEACVYVLPATSCALLYVSKVDSTGFASTPSPTSTLVRTLLVYYGSPTTRPVAVDHVWIQLFARAQAQYLFPNSSENPGKRPLGDAKLCAWWKRVLTDVATELNSLITPRPLIRLHYILPGMNELESFNILKSGPTSHNDTHVWNYNHPYSQTEIPCPCPAPGDAQGSTNLGHFIPYFDDDPKSRFMDEIAYITDKDGVKSPVRKRPRKLSHTQTDREKAEAERPPSPKGTQVSPLGELGRVSPDEFWERMSFRQECVAGAVTGFFTLILSAPLPPSDQPTSSPSPLAPQPGQVSSQINKRIMTSLTSGVEFSTEERAVRGTEAIEGAIKGLCEGLKTIPAVPISTIHAPRPLRASSPHDVGGGQTPDPSPYLALPRTPSPKLVNGKRAVPDVSPNPFPEPVVSLETYRSHIYGSVCVSNPPLKEPTEKGVGAIKENSTDNTDASAHVTLLTARRKKKRA